MPENFVPLHTEVERISSGDVQRQDVADYLVRHGQLSPYEARPLPLTGNSYDEYEQSIFSDFVGEFWNNSVVSAARGFANQIPISALADRLNPLQRSITPNERIAWAANLIGKEDAYRNSIVGKLLGNIESKYKKVGGYIVSDPLGLSSLNAAAGKVVGQEVRDDFFKNWIASVDKITESWKAPVTESKSFFQDPSGRSLVKGLGQGLGFISSVLVTKKAGAAASMATSVVQMTPMYYDEAKAAGLTDEQAASFATALSPIIGATEYFGLEAVRKVAMKPALNALRKESVVAGAKAFTRVLEETGSWQKALNAAIKESNTVFGKSLKTIGVSIASGAAIEGGEEFGQTYIEEGYKQYFDKVVLPESKFGADVRSREALLKASEGAFFGGILGGLLAGGHGVFSAPSNQEVVEQSMFNIIDSSNNKEKALSGILSNVETAKAKNTISDKEYEGAKQMAQSLYEYVKSVPVSLNNTTAKYQAYKFISDRNLAAEQLQALDSRGTDPLLATADDDMRGFLEGVIGVYNEAIETIGKTKGQVSDAEIERRITELRNTYFQTAEDTAVETEEAGIGEGVAADNQGIEDIGAAELEPIDGVSDVVNDGGQEVGQSVQQDVQAELQEYEAIYGRNQEKLKKLRTSKLKKGETQESRDAAIANLEQQELLVSDKINALKQQVEGLIEGVNEGVNEGVSINPDQAAQEVRVEPDEIEQNEIPLYEDRAEQELAEGKLSEQDEVEQEPTIKAIESTAENVEGVGTQEINKAVATSTNVIDSALDVVLMPTSEISTDESRFQNRNELNEDKVDEIAKNWDSIKQDPIIVWKDKKDGKTYVLSGHHRLAAAKKAGVGQVKVSYAGYETQEQATKFAKEEANANRTMETPVERAKLLREKRERGDSKEDIDAFLAREGKNKSFVENLSYLNPSGKAISLLQDTAKSGDKTTQKEAERISDWIGEARRRIGVLIDAHENEMFDFLFTPAYSGRITKKVDFIHKVSSITNTLDFSAEQPLNLRRYKHKSDAETQYETEFNELKDAIKEKQKQVEDIRDRFANPSNADYIPSNARDYDGIKKLADEKIQSLNNEIRSLQKSLQELSSRKQDYTKAGLSQQDLFGGIELDEDVADAEEKVNLKIADSTNIEAQGNTPASAKAIQKQYPDAVVVGSVEDLPKEVVAHIKELGVTDVMGVEYEGKVYMVAGNIKTMEQAEATYRHEVLGHKNVNEYLADTLPAFALSVVKEADAEQRKQLEKIAKDYFGKSLDALANSEKRVVGKEYIARIAEGGIKEPSVLQKIRDFFRDAFRALGIKLNVKDSEIRGLIYNADRLVKTGKKGVTLRIAQKMAKRSMTDVINSALKGYGINLQINGDLQQVSNEVAANIMREGSRISDKPYYAYAKKKLGEGTAKMMVEYMAKAVEASEARDANLITDFLLNKIPVKSNVLPIMELMGGELTTEFMNSLNQTAQEKQAQEVKRRSPFDVAKEAGFEMFEAKDESTLQSFKTYYRHSNGSYWQEHETPTSDGELICSIYNGGRWQSRYVFFVRNNNWENIAPADKLTQDNISKEWAEYLEKKGRKKEDGTYDLSGLRREREDPYSTSMLSIQVSKTGGAVDIISRYNHNVDNPNNTFNTSKKRVDSEYIDGLWESILVYTGFERKLKEGGNDLPENVKKSGGKYYFVSKEKDGEYWGDNFVIANNPAVYSEKYGNGVSVDGNVVSFNRDKYVTIEGVVYEKGKAYYSEISGIPVNKITQSKDDVEATYENGDYKYTVKLKIANGVVVKLWSDIESVGNDSIRDMAALTTLELPQVASVGNYSIRDMAALTTLELPQVASVGNDSIRYMNALTTLELPQVASVGNGSIGYMDNIQTIIIQEVVKMGYDSFDIREDAEIIRPENHPKYKLQTEITFTQSLMNDAIGIGDETDMQQLEDKGIIKKECE